MNFKLNYIFNHPFSFVITKIIRPFPYFAFLFHTQNYQCRVSFGFWLKQKIFNTGGNKVVYWPVHSSSDIVSPKNILVGIDVCPGLMRGCYIQGIGGIEIGDYTQVAPNVVIVSANHDIYDSRKHIEAKVTIGKYCWLGAGCKIMPGVTLGDFTIVGAGAVVTKSFPEGYCILGGVPAKKIKDLEKEKCIHYELEPKFNGYIRSSKFEAYRKKHLKV
jgi:acetyltransferase-like isoleucine patch superfamily enzyme